MQKHYLPQTLNTPKRILLWTYAEFCSAVIPFLIAVILKHEVIGLLIGYGVFKVFRWLTSKYGDTAIFDLLYWNFPTLINQRESFVESHHRKFLG